MSFDPQRSQPQPLPPQPVPPTQRFSQPLLLRGAIALMAAEAILLALVIYRLNVPAPKVLDITEAQRGVQKVLTDPVDGYGIASLTDVFCNGGRQPIVEEGSSFTCDVNVDRTARRVTVAFQDDAGTYAVDRPR